MKINGVTCEFQPGQMILQVANANGVDIPQYCYHDGLSIVASCRICLGEVWAPNPRNDNKLEPFMGGKLLPTCQTPASDGMVVHTDSPKAVANQKGVMEYLLINHPLDCPVCDQAGECTLQDFSYEYGRGVSRFEETKVKQPKKDLGPHVYLYSDRCILCTRCVRFTTEVSGTNEIMVQGRGNDSQIDVFPGVALDNELSANVIDLCPVGALLDKDFLFTQRVWFLKSSPTIDGVTASGDNIWAEHNQGRMYRFKPRENARVNRWWITDEVRYSWKFVHSDKRLTTPMHRQFGALEETSYIRAIQGAVEGLRKAAEKSGKLTLVVSPMLSCEDAYSLVYSARAIHSNVEFAIGPVPVNGEDKVFPKGAQRNDPKAFIAYAEKAPNARGVKRVLEGLGCTIASFNDAVKHASSLILTGNYPSRWDTDELRSALKDTFVVLIDTLQSPLVNDAAIVLPGAVWLEKAGTFENARGMVQAFEVAIPSPGSANAEGQIGNDLLAVAQGTALNTPSGSTVHIVDEGPGQVPNAMRTRLPHGDIFNPANVRNTMAALNGPLGIFGTAVSMPPAPKHVESDMQVVTL